MEEIPHFCPICGQPGPLVYSMRDSTPEAVVQKLLVLYVLIGLCTCVATPAPTRAPTAARLPALPTPRPTPRPTPAPDPIRLADARLARTLNLGNALEAPVEGAWGITLQAGYFQAIAAAGFSAVRLPVNFEAHATTEPPYRIDPAFLERVDWALRTANTDGLVVVLDMHNYQTMMDTPADETPRFLALWSQVANRYRSYPDQAVYFELLNEPNGNLDGPAWNAIFAQALALVRRENPVRPVIVGPSNWNGPDTLPDLVLPADPNLIVTFHYYLPFQFTHQGASWIDGSDAWLGTTWDASADQTAALDRDFDAVAIWAQAQARPVFLGEFGSNYAADQASRLRWTSAVARAAERRGFAWGYWEFGSDFGLYDTASDRWDTDLVHALIPLP